MLTPKPWKLERVIWLLAALLACVSISMLVVHGYQAALASDENKGESNIAIMLIGTLIFHGLSLLLVGIFLREHRLTWSQAFGFKSPRPWRTLGLAVLTTIVVVPIALSLGQVSQFVLLKLGLVPKAQQAVQALQSAVSVSQQIYFAIVTIILAPIVEEIIFRGILYPSIKQSGYPTAAIWGTSLLFASTHSNLMIFVPLTFLAVILTFLYETTDNLIAPITAHALFNATNFFFLVYNTAHPPA